MSSTSIETRVQHTLKLTPVQRTVLEKRYLNRNKNGVICESPLELFERVAKHIASAELKEGPEDRRHDNQLNYYNIFSALMISGRFLPNTPCLVHAGRPLGMLSACFVLPMEDSIDSILSSAREAAIVHKAGGGTGFDFSKLRHKNAIVQKTGHIASGPVSFLRMMNAVTDTIKQGSTRRGANMGVMRCVAGDTLIHTIRGRIPIKDLVGKRPFLYTTDGKGNVIVEKAKRIWKSDKNRKLVRVHLDNDTHIDCTPDHRFMLSDGSWKQAVDLRCTDSLMILKKVLGTDKYKYVFIPKENNPVFRDHRIIAKAVHREIPDGYTVHHKNHLRYDNRPENLEILSKSDHSKYHSAKSLKKEQERITSDRRGKTLEEWLGVEKAKKYRKKLSDSAKKRSSWNAGMSGEAYKEHYQNGFSNQFSNHKVVYVEQRHNARNVYDIQMPEHHNFVANDVFVHNCDHPDIEEFIKCKTVEGEIANFNISVAIPDQFMKDMISPGSSASALFHTLAENAWVIGDPGVIFIDKMNEDNYTPFIHGPIRATNPCVTGDTLILTINGPKPIKDMLGEDQLLYAWDPETKLPVIRKAQGGSRLTARKAQIIEIEFDSGLKVKCTPNHNFRTFRGDKIEAQKLKIGQSVRAFSVSRHRDGHIRAHGWVANRTAHQWVHRMVWDEAGYEIPEGHVIHHKDGNKENNDLDNLELMSVYDHQSEHYHERVDGGFGRHGWKTDPKAVHQKISDTLNRRSEELVGAKKNHKVISIHSADPEDVYNLTVDDVHTYIIVDPEYKGTGHDGLWSGIVSCNCGEQPLHEYDSCTLGSINVSKYAAPGSKEKVLWSELKYDIRHCVRFLDNILTMNNYPLDAIRERTLQTRRIGLGVMGFADLLRTLGLPYDDKRSFRLAEELMEVIYTTARETSEELAIERGAFPLYDQVRDYWVAQPGPLHHRIQHLIEHPRRNSHLCSIAPTGSISLIASCSQGIEPIFSKKTTHNVLEGEELEVEFNGKFKTANDIHWRDHVEMQARFQMWVDTSCSKTINMPESATVEDVKNAYRLAYDSDCRGITIYRDGSREFQVLNDTSNGKKTSQGIGNQPIEIKDSIDPLLVGDSLRTFTAPPAPTPNGNGKSITNSRIPEERPFLLHGPSAKVPSAAGSVLMNLNELNGKLFETVLELGKGGSIENSLVEALGRICSLWLRSGGSPEYLVKQLIGISDGYGSFCKDLGHTTSIPDSLARVIMKLYISPEKGQEIETHELVKSWAKCPDCGAVPSFSEGCITCHLCGYSKCG